jgi:hypothetical protein
MTRLIFTPIFMAIMVGCATAPTDPNAGMVAAREAGLRTYVGFTRDGKPDSGALLPYDGQWWFYHPSNGSTSTGIPVARTPPPLLARLYLDGVTGRPAMEPVKAYPVMADLRNGCLPRALGDVRRSGGFVEKLPGHALAITPAAAPHHGAPLTSGINVSTPASLTKYYTDKYGTQYLHPPD